VQSLTGRLPASPDRNRTPRLLQRIGPQTHRAIFADDLAVRILGKIFELEQLLRHDHVAFHADHFGDVGDAARAVAQALHLHDQIDRIGDLLGDGFLRDLDVAHQDHVLHTAEAFAWAVGVERTHGAIMAGVHRGEQIEALRATNFAEDDAVGRIRSAFLTRSPMVIAPWPSRLAGGFRAAASAAVAAGVRPRPRSSARVRPDRSSWRGR
jgi:hypothetical protein